MLGMICGTLQVSIPSFLAPMVTSSIERNRCFGFTLEPSTPTPTHLCNRLTAASQSVCGREGDNSLANLLADAAGVERSGGLGHGFIAIPAKVYGHISTLLLMDEILHHLKSLRC